MSSKPLKSEQEETALETPPDKPPQDDPNPTGDLVGPGGEAYGQAVTTPHKDLIDYPSDQDGVATAPPTVDQLPPAAAELLSTEVKIDTTGTP